MTGRCDPTPRYVIGTLVTDRSQHDAMRASFMAHGFTAENCEFHTIDNTGSAQTDAYRGLNQILDAARAPFVILCHQDVRLIGDGRAELDQKLDELTRLDPTWAVAGNAGGVAPGKLSLRLTDPHGRDQRVGETPSRVHALDENFLVVRRDQRVGFSNDMSGFHFYGADICLHADLMGCSAYVIDFHLEHLSPGRKSEAFYEAERAFRAKWSHALRPRWIQTTCSLMYLGAAPIRNRLAPYVESAVSKLARRMPSARGWTTRIRAAR
jgi:hypothetical protein